MNAQNDTVLWEFIRAGGKKGFCDWLGARGKSANLDLE